MIKKFFKIITILLVIPSPVQSNNSYFEQGLDLSKIKI